MTGAPDVVVLADHSALLAIPAFAPAIVVVGVVIWVARRDRRLGDAEDEAEDEAGHDGDRTRRERSASADEDGHP